MTCGSDKDKEEAMETSSEQDKEEKAMTEEGKEKRKKVEHDIDEGNIATAAAAALASAATKAKVRLPFRFLSYCLRHMTPEFKGIRADWSPRLIGSSPIRFPSCLSTWQQWRRGKSSLWWLCWWRPR